eukprot:scaffold257648_cov27-Tisochrysis_lutea.AAC.3
MEAKGHVALLNNLPVPELNLRCLCCEDVDLKRAAGDGVGLETNQRMDRSALLWTKGVGSHTRRARTRRRRACTMVT